MRTVELPDSDPTVLLTGHLAGRTGEGIVVGFDEPNSAVELLDEAVTLSSLVRVERGLYKTLHDFAQLSATPERLTTASDSGAIHGVHAVAKSAKLCLESEVGEESPTEPTGLVPRECHEVAKALLSSDFISPTEITSVPLDTPDDLDRDVFAAYMLGVRQALRSIAATVRARQRRRVDLAFSSETRTETRDRLATLLFVAVTNYPADRVYDSLGRAYEGRIRAERKRGTLTEESAGSPLLVTRLGGAVIRDLSRKAYGELHAEAGDHNGV